MTQRHAAAAFLVASGFCAGIAQVLLIRELLIACYGNEISLGLTLAAWLLCSAMGALWAGRRGERQVSDGGAAEERRRNGGETAGTVVRLVWLAAAFPVVVCAAVVFVRAYPTLAAVVPMRLSEVFSQSAQLDRFFTVYLAAQPGEMLGPLHLVLISFGASALPSFTDGALFAVGLQRYQQVVGGDASAPGRAYALDAIGHLGGGVLLGWAAAMATNVFVVAAGAGIVVWAAGAWLARVAAVRCRVAVWVGLGAVILCGAGAGQLQARSFALRWQGREIVDQVSSPFGHTAVARQGDEGVVFYENGVPSGVSPALPSVEELVQFALLQTPRPARVLLIGGGATGGVREVLKHRPEHVDYAELDPRLLQLARRWVTGPDQAALADRRVSCLSVDGRLVVKQAAAGSRARYDAIILLLPDPSTAMLNRYYTREWYEEARAALASTGVLAWEMSSSRHYFSPALLRFNASVLSAASVFPRRALMPGEDTLAVVVGGNGARLTEDAAVVLERLRSRGVDAPYFSAMVSDRLDPFNARFILDELKEAPPTPENRDLRPIGYLYNQAVWVGFYAPDVEGLYVQAAQLRLGHLALPAGAAFVLLALVGAVRAGRRVYVPLAVVVTGAMGMVLELVLLLAFQAFFGYVYHQVGVIIGAFMIGLSVGAMAASRWLESAAPGAASRALAAAQLLMGLMALALPWVLRYVPSVGPESVVSGWVCHLAFPLLTAVVGLAVGIQFPLATNAVEGGSVAGGCLAATLYAADLVGASLGATFAGTLLVPVLGVQDTCLCAAIACGLMAALLGFRALVDR